MKNFLFFAVILTINCFNFISAQSVASVKAERETYIWGEGSATTLDKAKKNALDMLVNQISVQVESKYEQSIKEEGNAKQGGSSFSEKVSSIVKTYSNATLTNVEQFIISEEPDAKVFLYIKKAEVSKIFASRKQKIIDNLTLASGFEQKLQIGDALRLYYWSLLLLKSHPDCNSILYTPPGENKEMSLITWLPAHINDVLGSIQFRVSDSQKDAEIKILLLDIYYKNQPVSNLDFCYWDGRNYSQVQSASNGQSSVELLGASALLDNLKIKAEYIFEYQARIDKELESIMDKIDPIGFDKSTYSVKTNVTPKPAVATPSISANQTNSIPTSSNSTSTLALKAETVAQPTPIPGKIEEQPYQVLIDKIIAAIRSKNYASVQKMFAADAYESFNSLVKMGNAKVMGTPQIKAYSFEDGVMCRAIPMMFTFANNNRKFSEDVVFQFNKDKIVSNITFGLSKSAVGSITSNPQYSEKDQVTIINFLENYKTAFALKRIDYLESIFADDALIIVGKYVKAATNIESPYANNKIVKYNRMSKQTYIKNLKQAFESNEFINIQFEDSYIEKAAKGGNVYGIEIKQNYFSSSYGDQGYLFLGVDLNGQPIIHIRAWQPEKRSNGKTIKITDF
jgi:hypothetical protein